MNPNKNTIVWGKNKKEPVMQKEKKKKRLSASAQRSPSRKDAAVPLYSLVSWTRASFIQSLPSMLLAPLRSGYVSIHRVSGRLT